MSNNPQFAQNFRLVNEKVFNNWPGLRAAVEHGMGGRNGHQVRHEWKLRFELLTKQVVFFQTAIEIMNYVYEYCTKNDNITQGELQNVIEDLMDEEFDTICDDGSIPEICSHLLRYIRLCREEKYAEIEAELNRLPQKQDWLRTDAKINYIPIKEDDDSSSTGLYLLFFCR